MGTVNKSFTFSNGTTSDATQVNADLDTLYTLVNGNIEDTNVKPGTINNAIATEAITPGKSKGLAYAVDIFGSTGIVVSGLVVTKDGSNANQIDITTGVVYAIQADGTMRRFTPAATNYRTASASATYYLDFQPDGTWSWTTGHSSQVGYVPVCSVTTDANSNVLAITDTRPLMITNLNNLLMFDRVLTIMKRA